MTNILKIAAHTFDIGVRYSSLTDFKNHLFGKISASLDAGSNMVIFPEYTAYAASKIPAFKNKEALAKMIWTEIFPEVMNLSKKYDAIICAGTAPNIHRDTGKFRNRAILAASGKSIESYKRCLAPWETDFESGSQPCFFEWNNFKFANLICFDVEFPEIAAELKRYSPHFVIVPTATSDHLGIERVGRCASARAVELGAIVVVSALVGTDEANPLVAENLGKCSFYFPAQELYKNQSAIHSPIYTNGDQSLIHTADLDLISRVKRMDSETKPFLKSLNTF
jgi:predicted amidohydrolase